MRTAADPNGLDVGVVYDVHVGAAELHARVVCSRRLGLGDGRVGDNHGLCVLALRQGFQVHKADPARTYEYSVKFTMNTETVWVGWLPTASRSVGTIFSGPHL